MTPRAQAREEVRRVAQDVLGGRLGIVAGCRRLVALLGDAGLRDDPDGLTIVGVESESDQFALPHMAHLWEAAAFREQDARRMAFEESYREDVLAACRALVEKASARSIAGPLTVVLVLDPAFGPRLPAATERGPVWISPSTENTGAVKRIRESPRPQADVTLWRDAYDGIDTPETLLDLIDTITEHHPSWALLEVHGVRLTDSVREALAAAGYGEVKGMEDAFAIARS